MKSCVADPHKLFPSLRQVPGNHTLILKHFILTHMSERNGFESIFEYLCLQYQYF